MASDQCPLRVAILHTRTDKPDDQSKLFAEGFRSHGCEVELVNRQQRWEHDYDMLLGFGPETVQASLLPVAEQLASISPRQRPLFFWWYTEGIPDPRLPAWLARGFAGARIGADRILLRQTRLMSTLRRIRLLHAGFRYKIIGEVLHFQARGLLGGLAVTSNGRADYLRRMGLSPIVAPYGYSPRFHGYDMSTQRDVDVAFVGTVGTGRRALLLRQLTDQLAQRGVTVVCQTNLYGTKLWQFLNRTKVVLNIFRQPYDFFGLRFTICAANKALFITEPVVDSEPFVPGRHLVAAPVECLADQICNYLEHDQERMELVEAASRLVTAEYTIHNMVGRVLESVRMNLLQR